MKHILAIALLCAALPVSAAAWPMAGAWFGTGQPGDRSSMYIDNFMPDGRFAGHFRACVKGKAEDQLSTGRWRVSGNTLTIDTATVDDQVDPRTDIYRIISVDAKTQHYVLVRTNFEYQSHKVDAGFEMPPCDLTS